MSKIQMDAEVKRIKQQLDFKMREIEDWKIKFQESD